MKYLGIDYGEKYIGLSVSDEAGSFAFPHSIVPTAGAVEKISNICKTEKIEAIVIGESVASNGEHNEIFDKTISFKKKLEIETNIPISFEKEYLSSVEASRYQQGSGRKDDSAAAIILQRFLDKNKMRE